MIRVNNKRFQSQSEMIAARARDRILALATKGQIPTDDPFMCEVGLAQVDATLAVAQAIIELRQSLGSIKSVEVQKNPVSHNHIYTTNRRVDELDDKLTNFIDAIHKMAVDVSGNEESKIDPAPWWAFWRKHGR